MTPVRVTRQISYREAINEALRQEMARVARKKDDPLVQELVGEMDTELLAAQCALEKMIELAATDCEPNIDNSNLTYRYKTIAARGAIRTVEKAMEAVRGSSFFRSLGLEQCFRDVQGARFHPFQERRQYLFSGRVALGLDPV
jgi:alkylation response protein AidB-like acyl-CoA dehydrogenase